MRICLFPGTFDPVTLGHIDIINRAVPLFDKVVIGIGRNVNKTPMFSETKRLAWLQEIYKNEPRVDAVIFLMTTSLASQMTIEAKSGYRRSGLLRSSSPSI